MQVAFILNMPNPPSWNGKWSGEGQIYAVVKSVRGVKAEAKMQKIVDQRSFSYHWDDGWGARIDVKSVDAAEARRLRKSSVGFHPAIWRDSR